MAKSKATKVTKGTLLNYLYGLRCDTNWSITAAIEGDRNDDYIKSLRDESKAIDTLVKLVKEKVND